MVGVRDCEIMESVWIRLESSPSCSENHRIEVTVSDIVIVISSTAMSRILTITDTTQSESAVSQTYY